MGARSFARYIGIPFVEKGRDIATGVDCWGLAKLVLEQEFGLPPLPDFADRYDNTREPGVREIFLDEMQQLQRWQAVESPLPGDVVVLKVSGRPLHVGVVVQPNVMLSIDRRTASCLEYLDSARWQGRIEGYYRHV